MDKRLALLETLRMQGDDGQAYVVRAYEHLAATTYGVEEHWESTGQVEYRLDDGRRVDADREGRLTIAGAGIALVAGEGAKTKKRAAASRKSQSLPAHARA